LRQFQLFIAKLKQQPFGLAELAQKLETSLSNYQIDQFPPLLIKGQSFPLGPRTYLMGIINLTPDSFSGDGLTGQTNYIDSALAQAERMVAEGADFLDVGAESTRPGASKVELDEELKRLLPALHELVKAVPVPFAVDTYKPKVASAALNLGAALINDIWGFQAPDDPKGEMARLAADAHVPVILMHNKPEVGFGTRMPQLLEFLDRSIELALKSGVAFEQIIVDPGIGFGKTYADNLDIMRGLAQLRVLGRPILLGTSRKSFIGHTLNLPVAERTEGTVATAIWGITNGVKMIRAHDIRAHVRAMRMVDAIKTR
jgi:dihydropteroate synthase